MLRRVLCLSGSIGSAVLYSILRRIIWEEGLVRGLCRVGSPCIMERALNHDTLR